MKQLVDFVKLVAFLENLNFIVIKTVRNEKECLHTVKRTKNLFKESMT